MSDSSVIQLAIIGAGPAGLSAALRAQQHKLPYIVLEAAPHLANTVYQYQKNKWVMAEPQALPLRGDLPFSAKAREDLLLAWQNCVEKQQLNIQFNSRVQHIEHDTEGFNLQLDNGKQWQAQKIIIATGIQGNPRHFSSHILTKAYPFVQYQLPDADLYRDKTLVIIGAGDAAIENALALMAHNQVILINRRAEFIRARTSNQKAILKAIQTQQIECYYDTQIAAIFPARSELNKNAVVAVKTPQGPTEIICDQIIARLGAEPPRTFLESIGVGFNSQDPSALPMINNRYESTVNQLYIIGNLAAAPLIKPAINQGFEVIEHLLGRSVRPADEGLLQNKFKALPIFQSVEQSLELMRLHLPLLSGLSRLQLREFMLDSQIHTPEPQAIIFNYNDYSSSFYSIISGEVQIPIDRNDPTKIITLRQGQFFGEMGLISGRRRTATVYAGSGQQCILLETPRNSMNKLIQSIPSVKRQIDQVFMLRAIQSSIAPEVPASDLAAVVHSAKIEHFAANEALFREGDEADCLHLIRSGSVTISRTIGGNEVILAYVAAGNYVGEMALLSGTQRDSSVYATIATETIRLDGRDFMGLLQRSPALQHRVEAKFQHNMAENHRMEGQPNAGNLIGFLVAQGLGEATDVLLIDEALCVGCDQCEKACAETHSGTSRLNRHAGTHFDATHVPTSCRHCENPRCMRECPPDAIHRAANGEVYIADNCIGCGACQHNCPYGVIQMSADKQKKPSLWSWLLFGIGPEPGQALEQPDNPHKKAVKCDMCKDLGGGPACVRSCPTGAAVRVSPEDFMSLVNRHT